MNRKYKRVKKAARKRSLAADIWLAGLSGAAFSDQAKQADLAR